MAYDVRLVSKQCSTLLPAKVRTEGRTEGGKKMFSQSEPERERAAGGRNNVLELILFTVTAGAFALFNIVYWSGRNQI